MRLRKYIYWLLIFLLLFSSKSLAWDCKTHAYIAKKAGIKIPEAACMPDIIREESYSLLSPFHYHNASPDTIVTPEYIDKYRVEEINIFIDNRVFKIKVPHQAGVLYWKIVDIYEKMKSLDRSIPDNQLIYEYYLANIAHYIGDLSQPLHNFPHGDNPASDGKIYPKEANFNAQNHVKFDEAFTFYFASDKEVDSKINARIKQIKISSIEDLKKEISIIANSAIEIARKCYKENRMLQEDEVINQIALSISLLRALIISIH